VGRCGQAGIGAAALYALDHHVDRIATTSSLACLAEGLLAAGVSVDLGSVETNSSRSTSASIAAVRCADAGTMAFSCRQAFHTTVVRAVTHLDTPNNDIDAAAIEAIPAPAALLVLKCLRNVDLAARSAGTDRRHDSDEDRRQHEDPRATTTAPRRRCPRSRVRLRDRSARRGKREAIRGHTDRRRHDDIVQDHRTVLRARHPGRRAASRSPGSVRTPSARACSRCREGVLTNHGQQQRDVAEGSGSCDGFSKVV